MLRRDIWDTRWLALALLLVLPGLAQAQSMGGGFIQFTPAGVSGLSGNGTTVTSTVPLLLPDGAFAAPALAFASQTGMGLYRGASGRLSYSASGAGENVRVTSTIVGVLSNSGQFQLGASLDVALTREAADTFQQGADAATAAPQTYKGPDSTGATVAGASLTLKGGAGTSGVANGGALILSGGAKSSTGVQGAVIIANGGTKPTCDATLNAAGMAIWPVQGGAGVADTFEVCRKDAANAYAWVSLF